MSMSTWYTEKRKEHGQGPYFDHASAEHWYVWGMDYGRKARASGRKRVEDDAYIGHFLTRGVISRDSKLRAALLMGIADGRMEDEETEETP